jgi:hypothetical protein
MTTALATIAPSLDKLIRRLGSNYDGERLATVQAIDRVLKTAGRDWHDLADAVTRPGDDWRAMRDACLDQSMRLRDREREFLISLKKWRGDITERQLRWLNGIYERLQHAA